MVRAGVLRQLGLQRLMPTSVESWLPWWLHARKRVPKSQRRGFDSVVVLTAWCLWKERNSRFYNRNSKTVQEVLQAIKNEALDWVAAGNSALASLLNLVVPVASLNYAFI